MITDLKNTVVRLANDTRMPMLGFGTWKMEEKGEAERSVAQALSAGYRHIDTAEAYENEDGVGRGLKASGVPREDIFLTTKCWNDDIRKGYQAVLDACRASLDRLGTDYLDLYLLHWPILDHDIEAWRTMEKLHADGLARAIGVCNYHVHHLDHLLPKVNITPMVNQVEFHPLLQQKELREFCHDRAIIFEAWSPIMQGHAGDYDAIVRIAEAHGKSPTQVVLRWDLQHGVVTIPKSSNEKRLKENLEIFDFELTPAEMSVLDALHTGKRFGPDPDNFSF